MYMHSYIVNNYIATYITSYHAVKVTTNVMSASEVIQYKFISKIQLCSYIAMN